MEELNLYDDLDEFQEQQEKKSKELQELENKYQQSLKTIEDLQKENKTLKKNIKTIELNFQSLLDTARAEIRRKNKEIDQLRKEKDDLVFRRKPSHKVESQKRHLNAGVESPEKSAQTFKQQETGHPESKETFTPQGNQTHDDKAENISKPGRDESFKRNRSQEGDHTNDNKRLKDNRDDRDYKYNNQRHKDYYTGAYKNSRQGDERNHSHDRRKYESAEMKHKTKSPERHRGSPNRSQSREHHRRDKTPERDKKTSRWGSSETSRPYNRSRSRESYKKHEKSELKTKIDPSNSSERSNLHKTQFDKSQQSGRYNFESRDRKEVNKYSKSTLKSPIGRGDVNSLNDKLKEESTAESKGDIKGGISAQNISNQTETTKNNDEGTEKVSNNMTANLTKSDNFHSTNRVEEYEEQPYGHKERNSDLKNISKFKNSHIKDNEDNPNANLKTSIEEDKTNNSDDLSIQSLKQSFAKQSSNENQFDKPSESRQRKTLKTVEASKLGTPCKVALFNEIFGQSSNTTTTSSSTKSLFNNIKGILATITSNEVITTATIYPGDCIEAKDCNETTKTKVCTDNISGSEMGKDFMRKQSNCRETTIKDLPKVMEDATANEIQLVQIPGLDLCDKGVIENHESLTGLFTKHHAKESEEQRIVEESNEPRNHIQNVSGNDLQMSAKLNPKDGEQQMENSESREIQSKSHTLHDNVIELEDVKRDIKQKIGLQMFSKQSGKNNREPNDELVADNVTVEKLKSNIKRHEHLIPKTSLDGINKNVEQNFLDDEQPKGECTDIQIESDSLLVRSQTPELVEDKILLENINKNIEQQLILQTFTNQKPKQKDLQRESEERKSIRNLEAVKDRTYMDDVDKTNHRNTLQETAKQNPEGNEDDKSIQLDINSHLVPENLTNRLEFVKDTNNVTVINRNTECIDNEKLSKLKTISFIESQNENVTEKEQKVGKTQSIVEIIEGEVNTKQDEMLYAKSKAEQISPQLNEVQVSISNNRNDDLNAAHSSAMPEESPKLTQEITEASAVSHASHDKLSSAKIQNSNTNISNENSVKNCRLQENKNDNLCDEQQNSVKCSDTNNDLDTNQVFETSISENISQEVKNNESCNILHRVEVAKPIHEYPLENLEFAEEYRTEITNSGDISNPSNYDTICTSHEKQNISEEITKSPKASDKHKDTDNDCSTIQEIHISRNASQDIKINESLETLNRRIATEPADEQYSLENQNCSNEITESANTGNKLNDTDTDSNKSKAQESNIPESTLSDVNINESIEILSRIENTKAADEQDSNENRKSLQEIRRNATNSDKPQVQEAFICENSPSVVKNNENKETINRAELKNSTDKQYPLENRDFSEEITRRARADNDSDKTKVQKAHICGSTLQEFKNQEIIETDRVELALAADAAQYPLQNRDFSEEITKTATTSDEANDTDNNSDKNQIQKAYISDSTSQDIINNKIIEINRVEVDKKYSLESQNCCEEKTKTVTTSNESFNTDHESDKTLVKDHVIRSNENIETLNRVKMTKATDQEVLVENQKILLGSGKKNELEENETENTSHNDASLVLEKNGSPPLEPSKSDNLLHTATCLRKTSLAAIESTTTVRNEEILPESAQRKVPETENETIIILNNKKSTILIYKNDRITVNENRSKVQCEEASLTSSVASKKGKDVPEKDSNVKDIKVGDSLMNIKVTESKAKDSQRTIISDPHTHSKGSSMDGIIKPNSAIDFTEQIQNQTSKITKYSGISQNKTSKERGEILTNETEIVVTSSKTFQDGLENTNKMTSSAGHETNSTEAEAKLPQSCAEKGDSDKTTVSHTFNNACKIKSNSCIENLKPLSSPLKSSMPNTSDELQNKTENIETAKLIEVTKKNISNSDKSSGIIVEIKRNENETITKQISPDNNIKSYPNSEILKVECSTSKRYQHENDFQKISPALPDSFNTSPTLPSISTSSPTPSNFSGIFSKKSSHLSIAEEDCHKLKKKSLHFSSRPREFIIPAASVLCNVDNLENATKLNKKLHWELLDNKNELTEIEDDTDIETSDEERHKLKGEIKQEQVTPQESPQQSPKDEQDEQSNPLYKTDAVENSQEENYKATQNIQPKIHKSKQYKYKLLKTMKTKPNTVTHSSFIDQKLFTTVLPKRQRGRPRKLENLLKATMKAKAGPRILKKRGRKPKKPIEFTESYDNNSTECAEPVIDVISPKDKIAAALANDGECALGGKQNEDLLAEPIMEIKNNSDVISHQEEEKSRQNNCELNDDNKQKTSLDDRHPAYFATDQVISNESVIKDVAASSHKDCDDTGKSLQISTKDNQNINPESIKTSKESNTKISANKPVTLSLNSDNNCDDVSTTSGDSENKLLIISDGGPEEINEKLIEVRSEEKLSFTKSKPLERLEERKSASSKIEKYISLEDIGIKVRPFKGHLSTLRIPKVNKDADQTNAWKLETYEELDKQQMKEKVEQKTESEMNANTTTVKAANKGFLATYRIPKIKRATGLGKDNLDKTEPYGKMSKEERQENRKESYHENFNKNVASKQKLNNSGKVTEAKSIDKTKNTWRADNAGLKEKSEKSKKSCKQQRENECCNAGSNIIDFDNKTETGKRKLFNLETYNDFDHEDKLENTEVNKQTGAYSERKLCDPKVNENESPCYTGKPAKLRRKSLNLPRKMLATSSDEEQSKHLENLERNVFHTRKKANLHRRILDSSCDEDVEVLESKIKEKSTNRTNKPLKQRRKSMFVESTIDFQHSDERLNDKKLTCNNLVKTTSCSETFDSEKNADMLSISENIQLLKTTVESMDSVTRLSVIDSKDTGTKNSLKIRRKSLFIESSSCKTLALDDAKLTDVMLDNTAHMKLRKDNMFESAKDSIKEYTIKNTNDNIELKPSKLLKSRRKSINVELNCARDLQNSFEDSNRTNEMLLNPKEKTLKIHRTSEILKSISINETSKKESSTDKHFDRENDIGIEMKSNKSSNSNEPINKDIEIVSVLEQHNKEESHEYEITKALNSSMEQFPLKPRRKSTNHSRILNSSSDDNEPLMKKPLLIVNEIKAPVAAMEPKTKSRKRRIVKVLSTSRDAINSSANSSLQSENLTQIHSNSPSPFASPLHNHPIFNREVSTQSREFVASMPATPSQQDDDKKFKEIDSKLHQIFQSPQYTIDYKTNHNTTMNSNIMEILSTSLPPDVQSKNITAEVSLDTNRENDQSSANIALNKPDQSPCANTVDLIKLDMLSTSLADSHGMNGISGETQPDINQENNQFSVNRTQINESNATLNNTTTTSHNCSEIKHLSLGSAEYRFEKVSDNVVNLFISRKRKRKRHN